MTTKLKEITFLTIKNLKNNEIILPGDYLKVFDQIAKNLNIDLQDDLLMQKELSYSTEQINKIVEKTSKSLTQIHSSTEKAQKAILDKDDVSLSNISDEILYMKKQISFLQKELFSDTLTQAYNRKWFNDSYLKQKKFPENGMFAFLDINKFKTINDTYGHLIGDQVLKYLLKFLQTQFDYPSVHIIRYAGDEFLIIFGEEIISEINVEDKMLDVQEKLSNQKLKSAKIDNLQFSFSYGLLEFKKDDNAVDILTKADKLMYENKQKNR
jgi:diguanylate cyclase